MRILVDTGFFFALLDKRDDYHAEACELSELLDNSSIVLPWPVLYEAINTRLLRHFLQRHSAFARFKAIINRPENEFIDDSPYRLKSYKTIATATTPKVPPLSLVDLVLRAMIEDVNVSIEAMLTFNQRDFADICSIRNVELLSCE